MQKLFGLIGYPLGHSFSKAYFEKKFKDLGLQNCEYRNFAAAKLEDLETIFYSLENLKGLNITIPHKKTILKYLDQLSEEAEEIGAVNVVKVLDKAGKRELRGYNTDSTGFENSFKPLLDRYLQNVLKEDETFTYDNLSSLVIGSGGAAKAVFYVLQKLGIRFDILSRSSKEKVTKGSSNIFTYKDIQTKGLGSYDIIINATPIGMYPNVDQCIELPYNTIKRFCVAYDLVYNPLKTKFLEEIEHRGGLVKGGLEMLYLQADAAWGIWND